MFEGDIHVRMQVENIEKKIENVSTMRVVAVRKSWSKTDRIYEYPLGWTYCDI